MKRFLNGACYESVDFPQVRYPITESTQMRGLRRAGAGYISAKVVLAKLVRIRFRHRRPLG